MILRFASLCKFVYDAPLPATAHCMKRPMNLLKAMFTVSGMTFISRLLGFVREALIARYFGAGPVTDAFLVAFRLPNLLRRVFAEGAFSQAFVPILAEYKQQQGQDATREFVAHIAGTLSLVLFIITALGVLAAPLVILLSAPGFTRDSGQFELTVGLLRLTFPYILLISLTSFASGILNTYNRFSIPAFTPTLYNVASIACLIWLAPHLEQPVYALAIGVLVGGVAQLAFQLPYLKKMDMLPLPRFKWRHPGVWRVARKMGPAVFAASISQISLVINTIFATFLVVGSVSWMSFADRLMEFPTALLGVALGTILLPSLSKHHANKSGAEYSALLDWGLRLALLLALPSAIALAMIGEPLTVALYQYGKFTAHDADMTRLALSAYAVGLPGLILLKVLAPAFYARQNVKTPVKIALLTLTVTQLLNIILVFGLDLMHVGLALSISLAALLNSAMLYWKLRQHRIYQPAGGWLRFLLQIGVAVGVMAAALWGIMSIDHGWQHGSMPKRLLHLLPLVGGGMLAYFATLVLCGLRLKPFMRRESN